MPIGSFLFCAQSLSYSVTTALAISPTVPSDLLLSLALQDVLRIQAVLATCGSLIPILEIRILLVHLLS